MLNFLSTMPEALLRPSVEDMMPIFILVFYLTFFVVFFGFIFVLWIFKAIAVFKLSKKLNLQIPWIGFIPYALPFAYGRIAEMYNKNHFKKPIKFSILLLILQFVPSVLIGFFYIFFFAFMLIATSLMAVPSMQLVGILLFLIFYLLFFMLLMTITFVVNFFNYLACWNVFAIFAGEKNILYFILSLTLGIEPFLLFALRNKEPQNLKEEFIPQAIEVVEED